MKIAIIGAGISGLTAAYILSKKYSVTLYEENDYLGGHANTFQVPEKYRSLPIDTGFIVFNNINYPNLSKLFLENNPEIINSNPIDDGWIVKIKISNKNEFSDLLTLNEYQKIINV